MTHVTLVVTPFVYCVSGGFLVAHIKALVTLKMDSGIPKDYAVNTFHFRQDTSGLGTLEEIADDLVAAYQLFRPSYPAAVETAGHTIKMYTMEDPEPRAPTLSETWDFSVAPTGNSLPQEVALCVSFQGARVSGQSQKRRRGRVYLGPLAEGAQETNGRPTTVTINRGVSFGDYLFEASDTSLTYKWCVYSTVDEDLVEITDGWVDNAFDIQRRRGLAPTARTTFS